MMSLVRANDEKARVMFPMASQDADEEGIYDEVNVEDETMVESVTTRQSANHKTGVVGEGAFCNYESVYYSNVAEGDGTSEESEDSEVSGNIISLVRADVPNGQPRRRRRRHLR